MLGLSVIVTLLGTARYLSCGGMMRLSGLNLVWISLALHVLPVRRYTLKTEHCVYFALTIWHSLSLRFGQAFGLLVSVSLIHL